MVIIPIKHTDVFMVDMITWSRSLNSVIVTDDIGIFANGGCIRIGHPLSIVTNCAIFFANSLSKEHLIKDRICNDLVHPNYDYYKIGNIREKLDSFSSVTCYLNTDSPSINEMLKFSFWNMAFIDTNRLLIKKSIVDDLMR